MTKQIKVTFIDDSVIVYKDGSLAFTGLIHLFYPLINGKPPIAETVGIEKLLKEVNRHNIIQIEFDTIRTCRFKKVSKVGREACYEVSIETHMSDINDIFEMLKTEEGKIHLVREASLPDEIKDIISKIIDEKEVDGKEFDEKEVEGRESKMDKRQTHTSSNIKH